MQIPLARALVVAPGRGREEGGPVVRLPAVLPVAPDVVVAVGIFARGAGLHEPAVLVRGVVHHEVHDELYVPAVHLAQQLVEVLHRAELGHYLLVVADVVAHVRVRRIVHRAEPHGADAEALEIVEPRDDAPQVAYAVAVGVLKAPGIDLIKYALLPPCLGHGITSFRQIRTRRAASCARRRGRLPRSAAAPAAAPSAAVKTPLQAAV